MKRRVASGMVLLAAAILAARGIHGQIPATTEDLPDTIEAIDHARVITRILCITAHPDDEPAGALTYLSRGLGANVALLSITRGEGGQNALGPEEGAQLAALRSHELLAATRIYGIQLFFTRAPDTGFVKTVEVTKQIWGDTALHDMVAVIRTFQPNIVLNSWGGVHTGHGHHQTSGILTPVAVAAAADPKQFPEAGPAWHVDHVLERYRGEGTKGYEVPTDQISPLWGRTYAEIGREGDYQHRTQGIAGFISGPFLRFTVRLVNEKGETPDPATLAETVPALATRFPALADERGALELADRLLREARRQALALDWPATTLSLAAAGNKILGAIGPVNHAAGVSEQQKHQALAELVFVKVRIDEALQLAARLHVEAQASRREAIPGETITVTVTHRERSQTLDSVSTPQLDLPEGWTATEKSGDQTARGESRFIVSVPLNAQLPHEKGEWSLPEPPPLVTAAVDAQVGGYSFSVLVPVVAFEASSTQVETQPLTLVPRVTLTLAPHEMLVPPARRGQPLEVVARVHYYGSAPAQVEVQLDTPPAWKPSPPVALKFDGAGDQLARLQIPVPRDAAAATLTLHATARLDGHEYRTSVEPLPTLPSRLWSEPAAMTLAMPDLAVPANLRVGYVAAENDPIPDVLREAGIAVDLLDPIALAFNDLSRYDAIAVGIRAYELRGDLARSNRRLLDYAAAGGTLVVQYQRSSDWNRLAPPPFPAKVGEPTLRVTDRNSPVRLLAPDSPLLNFPNKITAADFDGWVQERGLYFWGERDPRYVSVLALRDAGEDELTGGLVEAPVGKGTYIYTGLSFFRQLPEGVPGAVRLFVNLLSQSRAPRGAAVSAHAP